MKSDVQAAWDFHNGTKHPWGALLNPQHRFNPATQPLLYKKYLDLEPLTLPLNTSPGGTPALEAISAAPISNTEERSPDLKQIARLLYFSAGITKKIVYDSWGEMYFRAAACTGALYHIELDLVCSDLLGLEAGVYHYDPLSNGLVQLRLGDYSQVLIDASEDEPAIAQAQATLVYTDVFWRNASKYQARAYRHAFWDSGTILAHTLAMAAAHRLPAKLLVGFVDQAVNHLLGIDGEREAALALVPVGSQPDKQSPPAPTVEDLDYEVIPISSYEIDFPAIRTMHSASSLEYHSDVSAWRSVTLKPLPPQINNPIPLELDHDALFTSDPIEEVITRRGSTRRFTREPISYQQLSTALHTATRGIPADYLPEYGTLLSQAYLIVNAVDGLESGSYVFHQEQGALEQLEAGDFRASAHHLALDQALAGDACVNIYLIVDLEPVLEHFGNRGYRAAQLDASIIAGKLYLAAYAQNIGASGLTFYDDAVIDFFSPHARDKSVMFLIALGKPVRRK